MGSGASLALEIAWTHHLLSPVGGVAAGLSTQHGRAIAEGHGLLLVTSTRLMKPVDYSKTSIAFNPPQQTGYV